MLEGNADCDFCLRIGADPGLRPWYDFHELDRTAHFVVVAALGAIREGHVMIVSRQHVPSMAHLERDARDELAELSQLWRTRVSDEFGESVVLFEHGSVSELGFARACIVHAHWQLVPMQAPMKVDLVGAVPVSTEEWIRQNDGIEYLLVEDADGPRVAAVEDAHEHHFFRRRLLAAQGRESEDDYLAFPNLDAVRQTIRRLSGPASSNRRAKEAVE